MKLLKNRKALGCKSVPKIKLKGDSSSNQYIAKIIAKDYSQVVDLDYDTSSYMVKITSICILVELAIA